jgi:hypothetical protein
MVDSIPPERLHKFYSNDLSMLTDGAKGDDATRNLFWLVWPQKEFNVTVDLGGNKKISTVDLGALWGGGTTIPPASVECFVSTKENKGFTSIGRQEWHYDQQKTGDSDWRYVYSFRTDTKARYVRFHIIRHDRVISGRKKGMPAQTLLDEIEVR